jgi:hypothetical protein
MNSLRLLIPHLYAKSDKNQLISDMNRECLLTQEFMRIRLTAKTAEMKAEIAAGRETRLNCDPALKNPSEIFCNSSATTGRATST